MTHAHNRWRGTNDWEHSTQRATACTSTISVPRPTLKEAANFRHMFGIGVRTGLSQCVDLISNAPSREPLKIGNVLGDIRDIRRMS